MNYFPYVFIGILSGVIVGWDFFAKDGTYFLLDEVFSPHMIPLSVWGYSLYWIVKQVCINILGYELASKVFFFSIVYSAGVLGHLYGKLLQMFIGTSHVLLKYLPILFFMINPFFYERMITQPSVFLGILLLGFGWYFLLKTLIVAQSFRFHVYAMLFFSGSVAVLPHSIFMIFLIYGGYILFFVRELYIWKRLLYSFGVFIVPNIFWVIGNVFFDRGNIIHTIASFDDRNIESFVSGSLDGLGREITSLFLYGFWGECCHFVLPGEIYTGWYIAGSIILGIILVGLFKSYILHKKITLYVLCVGIISYMLALGVQAPWGFISQMLYDFVPGYIGLREPHKWMGVGMIVYAFFFGIGGYTLYAVFSKNWDIVFHRVLYICGIVFLLYLWTPGVLFGFRGQLFFSNYPQEYFFAREFLMEQGYQPQPLFVVFPWHSYIACDWTKGRTVTNIFDHFFYPLPVVIADNIEIGTLYSNSTRKLSFDVEQFLQTKDISFLKKNGITHIIFLKKCADFPFYETLLKDFLLKNNGEIVFQGNDIALYMIR